MKHPQFMSDLKSVCEPTHVHMEKFDLSRFIDEHFNGDF